MHEQNGQQSRVFNPNEHLIQLKSRDGSKDYLPVQWRLVWFRDLCPQGTIDTEEMEVNTEREVEAEVFVWNSEKRRSEKTIKRAKGYARYKAIVTDGKGGRATGTKSENAANFPDYIEKAETGAIGRALAALGYGTQFTGDELNEGARIVDAPVEFPASSNGHSNGKAPVPEQTVQQVKMKALLGEFYQLSPATYARIPDWEAMALRKALDLPDSDPLPTDYTDDDVYRFELYITQKKTAKAKVS